MRQTRALLEAWWELHDITPEPLDFILVFPEALKYTAKARRDVAERREQAFEERESRKSYFKIGLFLRDLGRAATIQEIATATGLPNGAVRQQLSRLVRRTEQGDCDWGYFREGRGIYSFRKRDGD